MKITNRKDLLDILKKNGYVCVSMQKHEKWVKFDDTIHIPRKHTGRFSRMLAERLIKEAKYVAR